MALRIYEKCNYTQTPGTISYQGTNYWVANSQRTIPPFSDMNSTIANHYCANTLSPGGILYNYSPSVDYFARMAGFEFTDAYIPGGSSGSATFIIKLNGNEVVNYTTTLAATGSNVDIPLNIPSYTNVYSMEIIITNNSGGSEVAVGFFYGYYNW